MIKFGAIRSKKNRKVDLKNYSIFIAFQILCLREIAKYNVKKIKILNNIIVNNRGDASSTHRLTFSLNCVIRLGYLTSIHFIFNKNYLLKVIHILIALAQKKLTMALCAKGTDANGKC